ncbi:MAG: UvrD-helicase domain-containing protein [Nitrospirae bacterium]|nr:UvrD-helicase domain-containing protein [Nitrospirota bacterium]
MSQGPGDLAERERAVETSDRNVVVTAGAGTGKTTLLVDRMVHLLLREPRPIVVTDLVALTFTKKAAGEIKTRLRERLGRLRGVRLDREPASDAEREAQETVVQVVRRAGLSASVIDSRVGAALRDLDRAPIGTIHSFASTLLRLYPLEAGVDPRFQEAEEDRWDEHVAACWKAWLDRELATAAPRADLWRRVLSRLDLANVAGVAWALCPETVPEDGFTTAIALPEADRWLARSLEEVRELAATHQGTRKIERQLAAAERALASVAGEGAGRLDAADLALLQADSNQAPAGWAPAEFRRAKDFVALAARVAEIDPEMVELLGRAIQPFATECRSAFRRAGWLSFDGLLARACDLVRDRPHVREALKQRFRALLIDEFQDTDPIQYEILVYLAEERGRSARDWRTARLEPGKLFIVGDPKQSIYGFRGADIAAYQDVVGMVLAQGGIECTLSTNFRSHAGILDAVNGACSRLIAFQPGRQAAYAPIHPDGTSRRVGPRPQVRVVRAAAGALNAEGARRAEAEHLARWLKDEVLGRVEVTDRGGRTTTARPGDVAILMRALTEVHVLLDALRRRRIPYVVEGERHFFATQEVVDTVNLLRAVDSPDDRPALVGVLRSALGGVTDRDLYDLAREGWLDYRVVERSSDFPAFVPVTLYRELSALHREASTRPVGEVVAVVFERLPIEILAAGGTDGDQAVANIEKVRRLVDTLAAEGARSFKAVIGLLERRVRDETEEGESPLADEHVEAVKVMSIHKAKGLEFPIVVLAGAHTGQQTRGTPPILRHWSSGAVGVRVGGVASLEGLYLADQHRLREIEEHKRLLYVAMTRARDVLLVSGAVVDRPARTSFLSLLDAGRESVAGMSEGMDWHVVPAAVVPAAVEARGVDETTPTEGAVFDRWRARRDGFDRAMRVSRYLTPTQLAREDRAEALGAAKGRARSGRDDGTTSDADRACRLGVLAHGFLQQWDYAADAASWPSALERYVARAAEEGDGVLKDVVAILAPFFASDLCRDLATSRILGREVPLIMPWKDAIMEGVIDLIYESDGRLYVADYKSDDIGPHEAPAAAERYRRQAEVYTRAVRESVGREVAVFRCIFLRLGLAVDLSASSSARLEGV